MEYKLQDYYIQNQLTESVILLSKKHFLSTTIIYVILALKWTLHLHVPGVTRQVGDALLMERSQRSGRVVSIGRSPTLKFYFHVILPSIQILFVRTSRYRNFLGNCDGGKSYFEFWNISFWSHHLSGGSFTIVDNMIAPYKCPISLKVSLPGG